MITKRILCLANSKKHSGRCVAGREVMAGGAGPWIRPVSARPGEEVSENERQYQDGADPRLLDVIDVPLIRAAPHACQTENWLLDPGYYWTRVRQADWTELLQFAEVPATLWVNGHSTYHGQHDEIPQAVADALPGSLYLIRVDRVDLHAFAPQEAFGNPIPSGACKRASHTRVSAMCCGSPTRWSRESTWRGPTATTVSASAA